VKLKKMNRRELEKIKKILLEKRAELRRQIDGLEGESLGTSQRDSVGDLSGYSYHMADVGTDNYNRQFNLELASNEGKIVYEIEQALLRMKERKFGKCEVCGRKIQRARLKVVPYARLCIDCKKRKEQE